MPPALGLGTVQFGLDYGVSNQDGRTDLQEVRRILELADENALRVLDTAAVYGESEEALGETLWPNASFQVVTKTLPFRCDEIGESAAAQMRKGFGRSLKRLNRQGVYGLLAHHADDLLVPGGQHLWDEMLALRQQGRVAKIGASVYSPAQLSELLEKFELELVQLPTNVFDQRFQKAGLLGELNKRGIETHVRSLFLQGLLLMEPEELNPYFKPILDHIRDYHRALSNAAMDPVSAALQFGRSLDDVDVLVVGVNDKDQLRENIAEFARPKLDLDWSRFALEDEKWINPARWNLAD